MGGVDSQQKFGCFLIFFFTTAGLEFFFKSGKSIISCQLAFSFFTVVFSLILIVLMMPEGSGGGQGRLPLSVCVQVLVT